MKTMKTNLDRTARPFNQTSLDTLSTMDLARVSGGQQAQPAPSAEQRWLDKAKACTYFDKCTAFTPEEASAGLKAYERVGTEGFMNHMKLHEALSTKLLGTGQFLPHDHH
jgi:hypothetical protein